MPEPGLRKECRRLPEEAEAAQSVTDLSGNLGGLAAAPAAPALRGAARRCAGGQTLHSLSRRRRPSQPRLQPSDRGVGVPSSQCPGPEASTQLWLPCPGHAARPAISNRGASGSGCLHGVRVGARRRDALRHTHHRRDAPPLELAVARAVLPQKTASDAVQRREHGR